MFTDNLYQALQQALHSPVKKNKIYFTAAMNEETLFEFSETFFFADAINEIYEHLGGALDLTCGCFKL